MQTSSDDSRKDSPLGASAAPGRALDKAGRELAERELRLSEQNYRLLIEEAPYAICRATDSGQLLQVNRSMLEMLGYSAGTEADLLIRDLPLIFVANDGFETFRRSLLRGDTVQGLDSAWLCRDGRQIQVRIGGRCVRSPSGETLYFDLLAENVTERKELEVRLAQAGKMQAIGQLAGGIAHDFNNLLTVINGYCDLLLVGEEAGSRRKNLEIIRQAGERAAGLTQQLLAFSRKQLTRTEAVNLNAIVAEVVQLSRRLIGENIRVVEDLCEGAGTVQADAAQIHQMLMNLVINARDAMPEGGLLVIRTSAEEIGADLAGQLDVACGAYVALTVIDSGEGMDDFVRAHIFEPFFTTKSVGKGTGLGLSTVYGTVRQTGGGIGVESRPGVGTTFRIYLPRFAPLADAVRRGAGPPTLVRGASTVLVVEDEEAVRRLIVDLLRDAGYDVLEAADAEEAMAVGAEYAGVIHLLLTDMVMPGMNGRKLAEALRSSHPEAKVLLVSGYSESLVSADPLDKSIRYLQKPFTPEHLTRVVHQAIAES
jgi:two-component system, cell cycle sensor histidine kinase and response regulator CckA